MLIPAATFGASVFFEGIQGRLVDGNGKDVVDMPGVLALCETAVPCLGVSSDLFLWTAVNNAAGQQIATNFAFCSDTSDGSDGGDIFIAGCSDLTVAQFQAMNNFSILEALPVNGVESTPYTPLAGQPGFNPVANPSFILISDVPEPSTILLLGGALIGLGLVKRRPA
jgi:hypothetical protein